MAVEGLPEGLVSNKEGVVPVVESEDRVEAEQVAYLWRGKTSQKVPCMVRQLMVCLYSLHCQEDRSGRKHWPKTRQLLLAHLE